MTFSYAGDRALVIWQKEEIFPIAANPPPHIEPGIRISLPTQGACSMGYRVHARSRSVGRLHLIDAQAFVGNTADEICANFKSEGQTLIERGPQRDNAAGIINDAPTPHTPRGKIVSLVSRASRYLPWDRHRKDRPPVAQPASTRCAEDARPSILFISRLPPDADGPGGTQRAMQLLRALSAQGTVDLVLLHRGSDIEAVKTLGFEARALVRDFATLDVAEWASARTGGPKLLWQLRQIAELVRLHAPDAPRFSPLVIERIGAVLPANRYDVAFAGRLSSACIIDQLIEHAALEVPTRIVDLDDLVSRFRERELEVAGPSEGRLRRALQRIVIRRVRAAELALCRTWDVVGLPVAEELEWLRVRVPTARLELLPNVIERPRLSSPQKPGLRILFVGHLAYPPNVDGLRLFLDAAWPIVQDTLPGVTLTVVGMYPDATVTEMVASAGAQLHANVASVEPYYRDCDVVISPIRYGSGTRIKIIEAMAFGRAVVSTTVGAEGLAVEPGRHALIADDMADFAQSVIRLCTDAALNAQVAEAGHALQQQHYSLAALSRAIANALATTKDRESGL